MTITYEWRGELHNAELDALHAECFGHTPTGHDWVAQLGRHSLGWVTARQGGQLVGFVNVAWDGRGHAFLLDTAVTPRWQRRGVATRLVAVAVPEARAAGCAWLHVDFEPHLREFYLGACGFRPTGAGLIAL